MDRRLVQIRPSHRGAALARQMVGAMFIAMAVDIKQTEHAIVAKACQMVAKAAKDAFGTHEFGWISLAAFRPPSIHLDYIRSVETRRRGLVVLQGGGHL
jgi:hypothetical protein